MTGRWPSLTNLRLVSAPMTPMPPVIRTFMAASFHARADRVDETRPVPEVVVDKGLKLRGREIDALETIGLEELACLRQVERLRHVGVELVHDLGRQVGWAPQREPDRGVESGHAGFRDGGKVGPRAQTIGGGGGENLHAP